MPLVEPFGSDTSNQTVEIGQQTFLGLTVVDINCNSSWDSQGAQCSIKLIQDHAKDQYLENVLVGTPQYFEIVDLQNKPIFRFYGILKSLSRSTSNEKSYTAVLQSPTILLDACSLITDNFAGYGGAVEAYGGNVPSCLDFGSNNYNTDPSKIFNIQNLFGVYENDVYGAQNAGFGGASLTDEGMRIDYFSYALEQLIEGASGITPQLGGNILYGTSSYSNGKAYAYNFDIAGFIAQISNYIPIDYRIQGTNLMEFISDICDRINHVFYIDLLKPVGSGSTAFSTGHVSTKTPNLVYPNTIYGGQIVVVVQNRNVISSRKFPLSRYIVSKEASDKLGWSGNNDDLPLDIGMRGSYHPDGSPSGGQGGQYPVEPITVDDIERIANSNLSVSLNEGAIAAKYVVGGYQSRVNYIKSAPQNGSNNSVSPGPVPGISGGTCKTSPPGDSDPTADVYIYWGEINTKARAINSPNEPFLKNAPVLTPVISSFILENEGGDGIADKDIIFIDMIEFVGRLTIDGFMYDGIYAASLGELLRAVEGYESWLNFMNTVKPIKLKAFQNYFLDVLQTSYRVYADNSIGQGNSYLKKAMENMASHYISLHNASASNTDQKISCINYNVSDVLSVGAEIYAKSIANKLSEIYKNHYGITYAVKAPAFALKLNPEFKPSELSSLFDYSWRPSQDGFLDPSLMESYFAPQGVFLQGGRLKAYVNYEAHTENRARYVHNGKVFESAIQNNLSFHVGLKEFSTNELYFRPVAYESVKSIVSVPLSVEEDYIVVPNEYFTILSPRDVSFGHDPRLDPETITEGKFKYLSSLSLSQSIAGGIPFFLVSVQKPVYDSTSDYLKIKEQQTACESSNILKKIESYYNKSMASQRQEKPQENITRTHPIGFGIPQQSTRYVYGPWVTQTTLQYATKIEVEQNTDLVPENYLGYQNMAAVGQLLANSVENFDYLYTEEGSVSIPGLPKVTHLGQSLVENGPLVSDVSINLTANGLETNYSMRTFAPKFGRIGKYYADKITRLFRKTL